MKCRGACCEQLRIPIHIDDQEFWRARGEVTVAGYQVIDTEKGQVGPKLAVLLEQRCAKLSEDGMCSIYKGRPQLCADYKAGGAACEAAVRARRPGMLDWIFGRTK
jgi:Fe-S-cluster containining protein